MTTDHAAARWVSRKGPFHAGLLIFAGLLLAGCETSGSLIGPAADAQPPLAAAQVPQKPRLRLALAPVIGAPDSIAQQLSSEISSRLEAQQIAVSRVPGEPFDYTLRGYMVAAPERAATKVSYIWDVTDPTGKRVNRVTGEEIIAKSGGREPWSVVTPEIVRTLADRTSVSLLAALPAAPASPAAVASSPPQVGGAGAAVPATAPSASLSATTGAPTAQPAASTTTGSLGAAPAGSLSVVVPRVVGAPGDGPQSLSAALQRELSRNGLTLANGNSGTHRVEGRVTLGRVAKVDDRDLQPIQIDWVVRNARGESLGTVSQKNDIRPGELDGPWGQTADAAAAAAAQGILKLLQQQTAAN